MLTIVHPGVSPWPVVPARSSAVSDTSTVATAEGVFVLAGGTVKLGRTVALATKDCTGTSSDVPVHPVVNKVIKSKKERYLHILDQSSPSDFKDLSILPANTTYISGKLKGDRDITMKNLVLLSMVAFIALGMIGCKKSNQTQPHPLPSTAVSNTGIIRPSVTPTPTLKPSPSSTLTATLSPSQTPQPSPTEIICQQEEGRIEVSQLELESLKQTLDYRLYLPPCYEDFPDRHYPVLYLIHGQSFTDDQWDRLGVDETLNKLITARELPPFLVVMPRDRMWSSAEEDPFDELLLQGLIPFVDSNYRTLTDRQYRAIGGLSRGAGWAVHLGLEHWELFGAIGMHSLALFWSDTPKVKKWLDAIPPEEMPRMYLDAGRNDRTEILKSSLWFEELLTQRNIPHEWHLFAGYHDEAYWSTHLEGYLRWYAAGWSNPP